MRRRSARVIATLLLLSPCFPQGEPPGQPSIAAYLSGLQKYRIRPLLQTSRLNQMPVGQLSRDLLREYTPLSYSRWEIAGPEKEDPPLELEVYELMDSLGAFGLFSVWEGEAPLPFRRLDLGVDHRLRAGQLQFWRGNYFFLLGHGPGGENSPLLLEVARELVENIPLRNLHPVTVVHLPREGLERDSIRYYLGRQGLSRNGHFPPLLLDAVGFEDSIEITYATYGPRHRPLFLIGYPTPELAGLYFGKIQAALQSYLAPEGLYMKKSGVILSLFLGPEEEATPVLSQVLYAPIVKWVYRKDNTEDELKQIGSFFDHLKRTALATLFFMAVTIAAGCAVGVARYRMLQYFPKPKAKDEMIRLNLDRP